MTHSKSMVTDCCPAFPPLVYVLFRVFSDPILGWSYSLRLTVSFLYRLCRFLSMPAAQTPALSQHFLVLDPPALGSVPLWINMRPHNIQQTKDFFDLGNVNISFFVCVCLKSSIAHPRSARVHCLIPPSRTVCVPQRWRHCGSFFREPCQRNGLYS